MDRRTVAKALLAAALATCAWAAQAAGASGLRDAWSVQETATLASMRLKEAGPRPSDPSNAYEGRADAAALGRALFNDRRLSSNGQVACASCHASGRQFQDDRPFGQGVGRGKRRTMPVHRALAPLRRGCGRTRYSDVSAWRLGE